MINGIFLINKKRNETSSKTLSTFKKNTKIKKAGIFGILDPLATGVLPIIVGEATKYITYIQSTKKMYMVQCKLGVFSDCGDYEDWFELYNNSTSPIDLNGFYLSDKIDDPMKWQFTESFIVE